MQNSKVAKQCFSSTFDTQNGLKVEVDLQWLTTETENLYTYSPKFMILSYFAMCPGAMQGLNFAKSSFKKKYIIHYTI